MAARSSYDVMVRELEVQSLKNIANQIMETVHRLQLPHKLDQLTEGRGNCFPIAIIQQCRRPEITSQINPIVRRLTKHKKGHSILRNAVQQFILKSKLPSIARFKTEYEASVEVETGVTWERYWVNMIIDNVWVDYVFVQATAWYLQMDI